MKTYKTLLLLSFFLFSFLTIKAQVFTKEALKARIEHSVAFGDSSKIPAYSSKFFGLKNVGIEFQKKGNKWALVNTIKNKLIIPYEIDSVLTSYKSSGIVSYIIKRDNRWEPIAFDKKHKIAESEPSSGLIKKELDKDYIEMYNYGWRRFPVVYNGKHGIINKNYETIVPIKYDYVLDLFDSLSKYRNDTISYLIYDNDKVGMITNTLTIEPKFEDIGLKYPTYSDHFGEHKLLYNKDFFGFKLEGKYGVMNYSQEMVVPNEYDSIVYCESNLDEDDIKKGKFIVSKNGKYGVINAQNKILVPFEYLSINYKGLNHNNDEIFMVRKKQKYGIVTGQNKILKALEFSKEELKDF